ncbi:MAG: hypothetical protein PSY12_07205 [bacterium]|nr:hypothetical protein [bacterium]
MILSFLWEMLETIFVTGSTPPKNTNGKPGRQWGKWIIVVVAATIVGIGVGHIFDLVWP